MKTLPSIKNLLVTLYLECIGDDIILLPNGTVSACPGEQLSFMCTISSTSLRWRVIVENSVERRTVTSTQSTQTILPVFIAPGISFNISRISMIGSLPIISNLTVANTTIGLNGTKVECSRRNSSSQNVTVSAIIVIGTGADG